MDVTDSSYAEDKKFNFLGEEAIDTSMLETFAYKGPRQKISYKTVEFSAVCPFSGLPDYGKLVIKYIPKDLIVELKALKYYIMSFRQVGIFQEPVTGRIYEDLFKLLKPESLTVKTVYNTRGGIDTTCVVRSEDQ